MGHRVRYGYPLDILATSLTSYGWDRRFILNTEVSRTLKSHRGIAPGSPYAPYELALHLGRLIDLVRAWEVGPNTYITLSVHVDDIALMIEGLVNLDIIKTASGLATAMAYHIEDTLGMKLDLGDKAFLLSSHEFLLQLARKALGRLGGTAIDTVRKLGVDYSLSRKAKKVRLVRDKRLKSGKKRWSNLVRLRLRKQGARVVHAGIIPHATFGAELYAPAPKDIKFGGTMLGSTGRARPLGVSNDFLISVSPAARDPVFVFAKAILGRWFREYWLYSSAEVNRPRDVLDFSTFAKAARLIGNEEVIENGPILAIRWAFKQVGWSPRSDGSVWQGERDIQVKEHSPALLLKMAWENRRSCLWDIQHPKLMERHNALGYQPGQQWVHQLVSDLVLTKYFVGRQVSLCAQLVSGTAPTGEWLHGHGWKQMDAAHVVEWTLLTCGYRAVSAGRRALLKEFGLCVNFGPSWSCQMGCRTGYIPKVKRLRIRILLALVLPKRWPTPLRNASSSRAKFTLMDRACGQGGEFWPQVALG